MMDIFQNPAALWLLTALPLPLLLLSIAERGRRKSIARLLCPEMRVKLIAPDSYRNRLRQTILLSTAVAAIILALAHPVWGTKTMPQPASGRDVLFVLDVSQSMLAQDQPPNRLTYAKNAILQCLDSIRTSRVGLIAFGGSASIKAPLTDDFNFLRSTLNDLEPDSVTLGGTRLSDAIAKAVDKVLTNEPPEKCDVIIITDGESHTRLDTNAIARLAKTRENLLLIGIGSTTTPAPIPVTNPKIGKTHLLTQNGKTVYTRQDSARLKKIADMIPGSVYINVGTRPMDLADIYKKHTARLSHTDSAPGLHEQPIEQYWRFLLVAIVFFLLALLPRYQRRSFASDKPPTRATRTPRDKTVTVILIAIGLTVSHGASANASGRHALFEAGLDAYNSGNFQQAINKFKAANNQQPSPVTEYNLGTAYYRAGKFATARSCFEAAAESASDDTVVVRALYNQGNSSLMLAIHTPDMSREEAINNLKDAIVAYQNAINIKPDYDDAIFNLNQARQMLQMMQNSQQQNQQSDDSQDSQDENDDDSDKNSDSNSSKSSSAADKNEQQEVKPPNLTPDDILKEEHKNDLKRSRKTHADFGKVKMNW